VIYWNQSKLPFLLTMAHVVARLARAYEPPVRYDRPGRTEFIQYKSIYIAKE